MRKILKILGLLLLIYGVSSASAQNNNNPLLYSNQAVLMGDFGTPSDPLSMIMPGTSYGAGFGSYLDNPASAALFKESFGEFGLSYNGVNEETTFLDNTRSLNNNNTTLTNFGLVYKVPTARGSLVIGGGYTQNAVYNRAMSIRGQNNNSTITDNFKTPGSTYADVAFNTFATDYGDEFEDWDESIFRSGFETYGDYFGIRQQGEVLQNGFGGEYSAFIATEFMRNFMVGASIGILNGKYSYDRVFQEVDQFNDYSDAFIDTDDDGVGDTDIDNILLNDKTTSRYAGFRSRLGVLYGADTGIKIGASYTLPTVINVDEDFDAEIVTTFDNAIAFDDDLASQFSYKITYPARTAFGVSYKSMPGVSLSLSAEYVDYSNTKIDFEDDSLFEDELIENDFIKNEFKPVWSFRSGISLNMNPNVSLRGGYQYIPSKFEGGIDDKSIYLLGAGFSVSPELSLELGGQYAVWEERSVVYDYTQYDYSPLPDDLPAVTIQSETADLNADRWRVMATLRLSIN